MAPVLSLLASDSAAFAIIFGIFVVALVVLIVIVLRWAIRSDRRGRALWRQRQESGMASTEGDVPPPPARQ
jgi:hypothetical protein